MKTENPKVPKSIIIGAVLLLAAVILFGVMNYRSTTPDQSNGQDLSAFAKCIANSGAKMYGASWCQHCQNQKQAFGAAAQSSIPYVECAEGNGQTQVCTDAGIQGYPTWVFGDGTRLEGEASLQQLSSRTGCALPQ